MRKGVINSIILISTILLHLNETQANDNILPQIERNIIIEQESRKERVKQKEIKELKQLKPSKDYKKNLILKNENNNCINISEFKLEGNNIFSNKKISKITKKFQNKCIFIADLNNIIESINELYFQHGYITSRASLPMPQTELQEGVVKIVITEGIITGINYMSNIKLSNNAKKRRIFTSFSGQKNKILNIEKIDQSLEQLNLAPGNNATMRIIPGSKTGESIIAINNQVSSIASLEFNLDNSGEAEHGSRERKTFSFKRNNLFNLNEYFEISHKIDNNNDDKNETSVSSFAFSIAYGSYNLSYNLYDSNYITTPNHTDTSFYGGGSGNSITLKKLLKRGKKYKLSLENNISVKRVNSYTATNSSSVKNSVSSRKLAPLKISLTSNLYNSLGTVIIKPSYIFGTNWFASLDDKNARGNLSQEAQYEAYEFYLYYSKFFELNKQQLNYNFTLSSKYSKDNLYGSEQISVGGEYSVRGFQDSYAQGDKGYVMRNNLTLDLAKILDIAKQRKLDLTIFYDYGFSQDNIEKKAHYLSGSGFNLNFNSKFFTLDLTYAKAINRPENLSKESETFYFNFTSKIDII